MWIGLSVVIVVIDRLVWWPLVVWSRRFKLDDFAGGAGETTAMQRGIARSRAAQAFMHAFGRWFRRVVPAPQPPVPAVAAAAAHGVAGRFVYRGGIAGLLVVLAWGAVRLVVLLGRVGWGDWLDIFQSAGLSFLRVLVAVALGTAWTVPVGVWIGMQPKLASRVQPFVQFAASFPAPMIYPWILALVMAVGGTLQWGAVPLIMLGTQWYILFNVAAAAAAIPNDLVSCANLLQLSGWARWRRFLLPAIFPGLVTGWVTAAGGAWNATIVSEYVHTGDKVYVASGLGALISRATDDGNFPKLAAAVLVMAAIVVGINRTVWKRLQHYANERCRFIT
jgi:NitT/TauT family transport system permease protein